MPFQKDVRAWRVGVPDSPSSGLIVPLVVSPDLRAASCHKEKLRLGGHLRDGPELNLTAWWFPIISGNLTAFAKKPLKNGYGRRWCEGVKKRKRSVCSLIS